MTDKNAQQALEALKRIATASAPATAIQAAYMRDIARDALREIESAAPAAGEVVALSRETMKVGGLYNWRHQTDRLTYLGRNWSGNGYWHQFALVSEPGKVWCEVLDSDLASFEETWPAPPAPSATSASCNTCGVTSSVLKDCPDCGERIAAPAVMDEKGEREAFERWAATEAFTLYRDRDGNYGAASVHWAWEAWKVRATLPAVQPEAETSAEKAVDRDEAIRIWHKHCDKFSSVVGTNPASCEIDAMLEFAAQADAPVAEPVALPKVDLRKIAEEAGICMDLWDMGAASLAHSEGCEGVTRADLERFAALYGFACWKAALVANPPNMQGMVDRALDSLLSGRPPAPEEGKDAARNPLGRDDARMALWHAMEDASQIGRRDDDKLIVESLARRGVGLVETGARDD